MYLAIFSGMLLTNGVLVVSRRIGGGGLGLVFQGQAQIDLKIPLAEQLVARVQLGKLDHVSSVGNDLKVTSQTRDFRRK
jgi:hypothetical protein